MSDNNIKQFIAAARQYLLGLMPADGALTTSLATVPVGNCQAR